ncbi:uncharacterized protein PV06_01298 [Exophiala oligosperma]|uniref:Uncharacterized protein n=1 Tax=Exophiala oligosperma TaxID=215243 RepID=A0A0D2DZZ9_9EURO|nr:uncharacterized protein PV06_01298 [Exophiala oligosperma]KIW48733.1 hypothetical protein PV06_01298 [Exophiala oligosperma]
MNPQPAPPGSRDSNVNQPSVLDHQEFLLEMRLQEIELQSQQIALEKEKLKAKKELHLIKMARLGLHQNRSGSQTRQQPGPRPTFGSPVSAGSSGTIPPLPAARGSATPQKPPSTGRQTVHGATSPPEDFGSSLLRQGREMNAQKGHSPAGSRPESVKGSSSEKGKGKPIPHNRTNDPDIIYVPGTEEEEDDDEPVTSNRKRTRPVSLETPKTNRRACSFKGI